MAAQKSVSFFKRTSPSNIELTGFWTREKGSVLCGNLRKYVPNDKDPKHKRPFFIFEVSDLAPSTATLATEDEEGHVASKEAEPGDFVGVSANYALTSTLDKVEDIGKLVRMTITGTAPNPNGKQPMILIDVEVAD